MPVICPICQTATSLNPEIIEDEQAVLVDNSNEYHTNYAKARVYALTDYDSDDTSVGIFVCKACGKRFVAVKHQWHDASFKPVYPICQKNVALEVPEIIRVQMQEANLCFSVNALRACVSMCQIVLETVWRENNSKGLIDLKEKEIISGALLNRANEIRLWGNIAKHESLPDNVSSDDVNQLLSYLDAILNHVYIEPARLELLRNKRESR